MSGVTGGAGGKFSHEEEKGAVDHSRRTPSPNSNGPSPYPLSPTLRALYPNDEGHNSRNKRSSTPAQPYIARDAAISRTDLLGSAERIYSRYLMPGADKEVYLPPALRIDEFPLSSSTLPAVTSPVYDQEADAEARVPDMFHSQKEYVYRAMEQDTFPRFLRAKAFGNLTPVGAIVRLAFGLMALWIGLATAFSFIFLDSKPKVKRLWVWFFPPFPFPSDSNLHIISDHNSLHFRDHQYRSPLIRPRSDPRFYGSF